METNQNNTALQWEQIIGRINRVNGIGVFDEKIEYSLKIKRKQEERILKLERIFGDNL